MLSEWTLDFPFGCQSAATPPRGFVTDFRPMQLLYFYIVHQLENRKIHTYIYRPKYIYIYSCIWSIVPLRLLLVARGVPTHHGRLTAAFWHLTAGHLSPLLCTWSTPIDISKAYTVCIRSDEDCIGYLTRYIYIYILLSTLTWTNEVLLDTIQRIYREIIYIYRVYKRWR